MSIVDFASDGSATDDSLLDFPNGKRAFVGLYYTNWSNYSTDPQLNNKFPSSLALKDITHIFYSFFSIDEDTGSIKSTDEYADYGMNRTFVFDDHEMNAVGLIEEFNKCKKYLDFNLIMSVGGWGRGHLFAKITKSPEKIARFVQSAIDLMLEHDFDGIDIDWEYPNDATENANLIKLLKCLKCETRQYLHGGRSLNKLFTISLASPAGWEQLRCLDLEAIDKYLHFWNVMTYDFNGNWSETVRHLSNLFAPKENITGIQFALTSSSSSEGDDSKSKSQLSDYSSTTSINQPLSCSLVIDYYASQNIEKSKLMLGMPIYGRIFYETNGYGEPFGSCSTSETPEEVINISKIPTDESFLNYHYSPLEGASFYYNIDTKTFITYDDLNVLKAKIDYCFKEKLGGGFFWDASGDFSHHSDKSYLVYFSQNLKHFIEEDKYTQNEMFQGYI